MGPDEREAVARLWAAGDYGRVAARLEPAAVAIAGALGDGHGRRALDLASGTGSVARRLAAHAWRVTATDLCGPLLDRGRTLARAEGVVVDWIEAPLDDLPVEPGTYDAVTSSFGLIFAGDPVGAVREAHRCLVTGGELALTAWTPEGYMGQMTTVMGAHLPASPGPDDGPLSWGRPGVVAQRLASLFVDVDVTTRTLPWNFTSVDVALDFCFEHSPAHVAAARAADSGAGALRAAVGEHLAGFATPGGAVEIEAEYLLIRARRR